MVPRMQRQLWIKVKGADAEVKRELALWGTSGRELLSTVVNTKLKLRHLVSRYTATDESIFSIEFTSRRAALNSCLW